MIEISAFDISPNDSLVTNNIFAFLEETFKVQNSVFLKETNKAYDPSQIAELAEDIVSLHELANEKKEGGEK
ncbi:MAG: hypothetical protein K2H50_00460 [Paramuribaculum sp.]|nr:hypothetical protein [Paramuribaculum sp.]